MTEFLIKKRHQLLALVVAYLLFIFIIRPWQLYFLNDDFMHIPMPNQWLFLRGGFMRPVPNFVLLWDKWLYGSNALGFFSTTLILQFLCVLSVYFFTRELVNVYFAELKDSLIAFTAALLFLFYPWHAESVMWVISRVSIIAAMLTFLSLMFYLRSNTRIFSFAVSWLCFVTALFTYESIWNIALLFGLISFANVRMKRSSLQREVLLFSIMLVTFIAYIGLRIVKLKSIAGTGYDEINENLSRYSFLAANLVKLTGRNFTPPFESTLFAVLVFAVSLCFYAFYIYKSFKKNRSWGWFMIIVWIAMITGVVTAAPLGIDTHYNESERYLYYSSFYFCFFIAFLIAVLVKKKFQTIITASVVLLFVILLSNLQKNYAYGSAITKTTVQSAAKYPAYKRAFFIDVPKKYKGTMIFRISLPDAIKWIVPQAGYDTAVVVSQIETPSGKMPYKTGETTWKELAAFKGWNVSVATIFYKGRMDSLKKEDVVFWYKEDGLYKINLP